MFIAEETELWTMYRVSIKCYLDYKHLLQGNYVEYIFFTIT